MAISMGHRGGHPDHGMGGSVSGHSSGSGMEGPFGGGMRGPDAFGGKGRTPIGGYTGIAADAMKNIRGRQEMSDFLTGMSQRYGFDSVSNFIQGYMGQVNTPMNPNMDTQEQQNAMINNAAQNYTQAAQNFNLSQDDLAMIKGLMFESPHEGFGSLHTPGYTTTRSPVTNPEQRAYGLHGYGFSPMGFQGMNELGLPVEGMHNIGSSFNTGIFGPSQAELNAINQNQPSYAEQAQNMNVDPMGFGPSQGLGYNNFGELNR
jgi:hypothetical protein